ncbi:1-acyl-sn-glycerol-3-phosphate acyltransferase alpha-like isoform X2 [Planococcus citri]
MNMKLEYWITTLLPVLILIYRNPKWRRTVKCYVKYLVFFVYLASISTLGLPLCLKHPANCKSMWVYASLLTPVSKILGIKWEIRHREKMISNDKSSICIANHQSLYDIVGMLLVFKSCSLRCGIIARNFFFWLWPVGLAMWMAGIVFIRRQTGLEKTKQCFNEGAQRLFKNKEKLWVFVEGTRNKHPETLLPFKKGAFVTAIDNQVPLQPILFSPFYFVDIKEKRFDSGKIIIEVMDPISTEGLTRDDLDDLVANTYTLMSEKHKQLMNELKPCVEEYKNSISR